MSYGYDLSDLLSKMYGKCPTKVDAVTVGRRRVEDGLLSVGIKIHCLGSENPFGTLFEGLVGATNPYRRMQAVDCVVLPPVGNARTAAQLLEVLEIASGVKLFNNKRIQLQVCSPGRLAAEHSALLGIGFYLGSDVLRHYSLADFTTTFTQWESDELSRGQRLVLYDARGTFDRRFEWWWKHQGRLLKKEELPFKNGRTDMLGVYSVIDIENINLIATLLVHLQYGGYWAHVGSKFKSSMLALLKEHQLTGLIHAPWVRAKESPAEGDELFRSALGELTAYAFEDRTRVSNLKRHYREQPQGTHSILLGMKAILSKYRTQLMRESEKLKGGSAV